MRYVVRSKLESACKYAIYLILMNYLGLVIVHITVPHRVFNDVYANDTVTITDTCWSTLANSSAGIWKIDGKMINLVEKVTLPPGPHRIEINCTLGFGSKLSADTQIVVFIAESGHKYQVWCSKNEGAWIEDTTTKKRVGHIQNDSLYVSDKVWSEKEWKLKKEIGAYCPNADSGVADAQKRIGDLLYLGHSGDINRNIRAYVWYSLAASNGHTETKNILKQIEKDLSDDQIKKAKRQLAEWMPGQCKEDVIHAFIK